MATHGCRDVPQSNLSKTGQTVFTDIVFKVAHTTKNDQGPLEEHTEDHKTFGYVESEKPEDQRDESTIFDLGSQGRR